MNALVESVHKYIANTNIKQALLIDGEWGCGKTHFIKFDLIPQRNIIIDTENPLVVEYAYISLFGIDSPKKLMTKINSELLLITLTEVNTLMTYLNENHQLYLEGSHHKDNKQIYDGLSRLLSSLELYIRNTDDNLWLFYLNELKKRLQTKISKFPEHSL